MGAANDVYESRLIAECLARNAGNKSRTREGAGNYSEDFSSEDREIWVVAMKRAEASAATVPSSS